MPEEWCHCSSKQPDDIKTLLTPCTAIAALLPATKSQLQRSPEYFQARYSTEGQLQLCYNRQ
jgi:hypothetical protein